MQKMKNLRILGITSLALGGISFILLLVSMMIPANPYLDPTQYNALIALLVVGSIMMGISGLISLMGSIMILVSDFDNQEVNGSKVLWGVLSLLLLGALGILIFTGINQKHFSSSSAQTTSGESVALKDSNEVQGDVNNADDKLDTITKAFKLFEQGVITQEEFNKIKDNNL